MSSVRENLNPDLVRRLAKELADLQKDPPEGIKVLVNEENVTDVQALVSGPPQTPYEGGLFRVKLCLPNDFPATPPKGLFLTKVFHPNVSEKGDICVNTLKKDWEPTHGLRHILLVVKCLLIHPNPESALNEDAGKLIMDDYPAFQRKAAMMTRVHATPKPASSAALSSSSTAAASAPAPTKAKADAAKKRLKRL